MSFLETTDAERITELKTIIIGAGLPAPKIKMYKENPSGSGAGFKVKIGRFTGVRHDWTFGK